MEKELNTQSEQDALVRVLKNAGIYALTGVAISSGLDSHYRAIIVIH